MSAARDVLAAMRVLPMADLDEALGKGPLVVLAPHQDDEALGCGGIIARACAQGRSVRVVFLTDGAGSHPDSVAFPRPRLIATRRAEALLSCARLGVAADDVAFLDLPDTDAPHEGAAFEAAVGRLLPLLDGAAVLATTWEHDPHGDHGSAAKIARAAAALVGCRLVFFPVWGWTLPDEAWLPDATVRGWRIDISMFAAIKREAIEAHGTQMTDLIDDDPNGFRLSAEFLALFETGFEVLLDGAVS